MYAKNTENTLKVYKKKRQKIIMASPPRQQNNLTIISVFIEVTAFISLLRRGK